MKRLLGALVVVCACAGVLAQTRAVKPKIANAAAGEVAKSRPVADRAAIRLVDPATATSNAILFVQFGGQPVAARIMSLETEQGPTSLRDDGVAPDVKAGDGIHSAHLRVDIEQLRTRQQKMLSAKSLPLFVGRELVGHATATLVQTPLALKDLPIIPNEMNYRPAADGKELALALRFAPIRAGRLIPIYPSLFTEDAAPVAAAGRVAQIAVVMQDPDPSIIITQASALQDPDRTYQPCTATSGSIGNWTFGHLMTELAQDTGIPPAEFVESWLEEWQSTQTINGFAVPARSKMQTDIIANWPRKGTALDLEKAPFKLVAIVNRIDLGKDNAYGSTEKDGAGEARFIFAATGPLGDQPCTELPVLVIFEYKVPISGCGNVKQWARQWQDLESFLLQGDSYRNALEAITLQFTEAGTNPSQWPNHSSLAQIRTNMFLPDGPLTPWELREFRLPDLKFPVRGVRGALYQTTVKQTPDISFDQSQALADYAFLHADAIITGVNSVPESLPSGQAFLAASAPLPGDQGGALAKPSFFWDGPRPAPSSSLSGRQNLRHTLSLNTCNGCHGEETGAIFTHVSEKGQLSGFMTGTLVVDPAGEKRGRVATLRRFNDIARRKQRMAQILNDPCWSFVYRSKFKSVH